MNEIKEKFAGDTVVTVIDGDLSEANQYTDCDTLIVVPCSGSVQPDIIRLSEPFEKIILCAGYVPGNYSLELTDKMLCKNASPTLMDTFGVLKRDEKKIVVLKKNFEQLSGYRKIVAAYDTVKNGKITIINGPEPWVISVSRKYEDYEKQLGIEIDVTTPAELIDLYENTTVDEAKEIYEYYRKDASEIKEPTDDDIMKCSRLAKAMMKLIQAHQSNGLAIACFDLIGRIETEWFAACEGDIDSAVTMLMMHSLTHEKPWMANPCLQSDDTINFAHCTAPLRVHGEKQQFILRNHHETGAGASPRVFYNQGLEISMFRYSGVQNVMTFNKGISVEGRYEPNCRTQMRIQLDDFAHYIDTAVGCHQVLTFEDILDDMKELCILLNVKNV